jgi:hypothetical protein
MDKVLIFTNARRGGDISLSFRMGGSWAIVYSTIDDVDILAFSTDENHNPTLKAANSFNEEGIEIYFVYDEIDKAKLGSLLDACPNDTFYILVHQASPVIKTSYFEQRANCHAREGSHQSMDFMLYYPVFRVLFDRNQTDKLNRIIEILHPPIETVIRFLNECLKPGNGGDGTPMHKYYQKILLDAKDHPDVQEALRHFFKDIYPGKNSFEEYERCLEDLRDELLKLS